MRMFLVWSGRKSGTVAEAFRQWLPQVIQAIDDPFISTAIEKGKRWNLELAARLADAAAGIVCLTRDNLTAPWLLFEAGALAKKESDRACTFLLDLEPSDVEAPLADLQHTRFDKDDVLRLVKTLNTLVGTGGEKNLQPEVLARVFERFWPELEEALNKAKAEGPASAAPIRDQGELLKEILELVRGLKADREADVVGGAGRASGRSTARAVTESILARDAVSVELREGAAVRIFAPTVSASVSPSTSPSPSPGPPEDDDRG